MDGHKVQRMPSGKIRRTDAGKYARSHVDGSPCCCPDNTEPPPPPTGPCCRRPDPCSPWICVDNKTAAECAALGGTLYTGTCATIECGPPQNCWACTEVIPDSLAVAVSGLQTSPASFTAPAAYPWAGNNACMNALVDEIVTALKAFVEGSRILTRDDPGNPRDCHFSGADTTSFVSAVGCPPCSYCNPPEGPFSSVPIVLNLSLGAWFTTCGLGVALGVTVVTPYGAGFPNLNSSFSFGPSQNCGECEEAIACGGGTYSIPSGAFGQAPISGGLVEVTL